MLTVVGWSKPTTWRGTHRGKDIYYSGVSHLLVRDDAGIVRSRCGARFDALTPPAESPPVASTVEVCLRCSAPYAKEPTARSLRAPKGETE